MGNTSSTFDGSAGDGTLAREPDALSIQSPLPSNQVMTAVEYLSSPARRKLTPMLTPKSAIVVRSPKTLTRRYTGEPREGESYYYMYNGEAQVDDDEPIRVGKLMTTNQALFSVLNVFVGLGLLSKPYALAQGGWVSLAGVALLCILVCWSGKALVACFVRVADEGVCTFPQLGERCYGAFGRWLVTCIIGLEFSGATIIVLIFTWQNLLLLLPDSVTLLEAALCSTAAMLPTLLVTSFAELSFISLLGAFSSLLIAVALMGVLLSDTGRVANLDYKIVGDLSSTAVSLGIYVVSLGGHACLPSVYASMAKPESFDPMLNRAFVLMFAIYAACATCGYLIYGSETDILVTTNLEEWPGGALFDVFLVFVVANSFCSVAPIIQIVAEIPEELLGVTSALARKGIRVLILLCAGIMAYLLADDLDVVEAITGGALTLCTSLVFPTLFHLSLFGEELSKPRKVLEGGLVVLGVLGGIALTTGDILELLSR